MNNVARLALGVLLVLTVGVSVAVFGDADSGPVAASRPHVGSPLDVGSDASSETTALVFPTRADACVNLLRSDPEPVDADVARADSDDLAALVGTRADVTMVGLSTCGELYVVVIGVTERGAELPARGPQGTPVIAFTQKL